ncbi:MAG: hypothetical protein AAF531_11250 [Actinomycetota bacterium]
MRRFVRHLLFVYVVAVITVVGSERMFWYWTGSASAHLEGAIFYSASTAGFLAVLRRFEVHSWWGVVLSVPIYAYITEGVITPVLYSGGPTPVFPLWFTGWHGLLSVLLLFVGVRALAVAGRRRWLAGLSVALGVFWGSWLITSLLPHQLNDPELIEVHGELIPLPPASFLGYAVVFTGFLFGGHLLLNRVWPTEPHRLMARSDRVLAVVLLLGAALWTVAVPWALPMFVGLCWLQFRFLRRHRTQRDSHAPTFLEALAGPVSWRSLVPLTLIAPVAAGTYWLWWTVDPPEATLDALFWGVITVQTVVAAVVLLQAVRTTHRTPTLDDRSPPVGERRPVAPAPGGDLRPGAEA